MYGADCGKQVVHPFSSVVRPMRSFVVMARYDDGLSSCPVPIAIAVAFRSWMSVYSIAPCARVQVGSQKVESSTNPFPAGIPRTSRRSAV